MRRSFETLAQIQQKKKKQFYHRTQSVVVVATANTMTSVLSPPTMDKASQEEIVSPSGLENVPSGFILKLYQMVNGAPDEVINVSCKTTFNNMHRLKF